MEEGGLRGNPVRKKREEKEKQEEKGGMGENPPKEKLEEERERHVTVYTLQKELNDVLKRVKKLEEDMAYKIRKR